jgi:hypothetical protein
MPKPKLLRSVLIAFLFFVGFANISASCVDSVRIKIDSVRCYGLRNGSIKIDTVFGGEPPFYYAISIDSQAFSTNPTFDRLWAGYYTVYVRDASDCIKHWRVKVDQPEKLELLLSSPDTVVELGVPVQIKARFFPANAQIDSIIWRPPFNFLNQNQFAQTVTFSESTTVAVQIMDSRGCIADDQIQIIIETTGVFFPNIINPLSNNNDFFTAVTGEGVAEIQMLQIYSRDGSLLFDKKTFPPNDPLLGWNGKSINGKRVQTGVYLYMAQMKYLDGSTKSFSGTVTVVY